MDERHYIVAGSLIDGSGGEARRNVVLTVQNGIISGIAPATTLPRAETTAFVDLSHCVIVPALVDCSITLTRSPCLHLADSADMAIDPAQQIAMLERHVRYCHGHGVLGVADSNDRAGLVARWRRETGQKALIDARTGASPRPGDDQAPAAKRLDHDFLRISYGGGIDDEQAPAAGLDHPELCRLLRDRGTKKAVVMANGRQRVAEALAAGCDAIEQGYGMGEDNLRLMAEKNILWIPSVVRAKNGLDGAAGGGAVCCRFSQRYVAPGKAAPGAEEFWKKTLAEHLALLRAARKMGVPVATGTGAGSAGILHGEAMVEEIKLFIRAGYKLEKAIRCASTNGAAFFGMDKPGLLAVGRRATFLVARGTVGQLPRKLAYLEGIFIDGVPSPAYHKNPLIMGRSDSHQQAPHAGSLSSGRFTARR